MISTNKKIGFELGLVILILALPISQILKLLTNTTSVDFTNILLLVSLCLICNIKNLLGFKFPQANIWFVSIIFFQVLIICLAVQAHVGLSEANYGIIYSLYLIFLIIFISTNERTLDYRVVLKFFIYTSGIFNVLLLYYLTNNFSSLLPNSVNIITAGDLLIADRLTLSCIAYFYIISMLVIKTNKKSEKVAFIVFLLAAILNITATSRRGLMVALILILILHLILKLRENIRNRKMFGGIIQVILASSIIYMVLFNIPGVDRSVHEFTDRMTSGIETFVSGEDTSDFDSAAYSRVVARESSYDLLKHAPVMNFLFGFGYMHKWIDFPFLQIIVDTGIFGGFIYLYIQVSPLIEWVFRGRTGVGEKRFFFYLSIVGLLNNFYSGVPYGYYKYLFLVPCIYVLCSENRETIKAAKLKINTAA